MLVMMGLQDQVEHFGIYDQGTLDEHFTHNELMKDMELLSVYDIDYRLPPIERSKLLVQRVNPQASLTECITTVPHRQLAKFKSMFFKEFEGRKYTIRPEYMLGLVHGTPKNPKIYEVFRVDFSIFLFSPHDLYAY